MRAPTPLRPLRGSKKKKREPSGLRDPKYRAWIRTLPCLGCNARLFVELLGKPSDAFGFREQMYFVLFYPTGRAVEPLSECAHSGPHGISQKAPDKDALPLCVTCHREGKYALDRIGPKAFEHLHQINIAEIRAALRAEYERTRN